jgi:hypothetical protein
MRRWMGIARTVSDSVSGEDTMTQTLKYVVTKLHKNSHDYGYYIQLAESFRLRDVPSVLGSHIPNRAELKAFLKSRCLIENTAETIMEDLDALPPGREFYVLVYDC